MSSVMSGGMHGHSTPISRDHQGNTAGGICTCKAGHQLWCHRAASAGVLQARPAGVMICDSSWLQQTVVAPDFGGLVVCSGRQPAPCLQRLLLVLSW